MKIYLVAFITTLTSLCFGQELVVQAPLESIEFVKEVDKFGEDIYCAGISFKTALNDGYSCYAYLIHYDNTLKSKWVLKFSDGYTNQINAIKRHKDKIYALVTQSKEPTKNEDGNISLFTINLEGVIEDKLSFGTSISRTSNIIFNGSNLIFGHTINKKANNINDTRSEIVQYHLDTKKTTKIQSTQYQATPEKIINNNADIYLFGNYIHPSQPNIMTYRNGKYSELNLKSSKTEYFINAYVKQNILTVICAFPGVYGDMKKYLKYYYINTVSNTITSKTLSFEKLGWNATQFGIYTQDDTTWIAVEDSTSKATKYVLIDDKGNSLKTLNFDFNNGRKTNCIIEDTTLLNVDSKGIKLFKIAN